MALRVLLADESSTIKKVMQLALSDFAVEVKSVPVGLDVLQVAKSYKPDIVFADVLLTKRSGYEVCMDLKNDAETNPIPVVLMWSGFMDIDEVKARECQADRRLEKPFDADHLRSLVTDLVKKTNSNPIASFVTFPDMPDFDESAADEKTNSGIPETSDSDAGQNVYAMPEDRDSGYLNIPELDSTDSNPLELHDEEFAAVPLTNPKAEDEHDEGGWAHQDLTKFKIQIPQESETGDFASKFVIPQDDLEEVQLDADGNFEEVSFVGPNPSLEKTTIAPSMEKTTVAPIPAAKPAADSFISSIERSVKDQMMQTLSKQKTAPSAAQPNSQSKGDIDANMMEKVIRDEARGVIEAICWKVIPEIAERIVREEINKILRETEKSI